MRDQLKDEMVIMENRLNGIKEKKYVFWGNSTGPNNLDGLGLHYLDIDYDGHSINKKFSTPEFGWWNSLTDFMNNMKGAMRSVSKSTLEDEYELVWLRARPTDEEGCKLLGL